MAASEDKSFTFSAEESTLVVTSVDEVAPSLPTSTVEGSQNTIPVASTLDPISEPVPLPVGVEHVFGLSPRDCFLLLVLASVCIGLGFWHWVQLSGGGITPIEVERLPERVYDYRIDINEATWAEWMHLPGVGKTLAQRILDYREQHGPFESVDDLDAIKGIGPKTLEKLRPWLTVREKSNE